jgi:lipoprotein-releasing system permease protein
MPNPAFTTFLARRYMQAGRDNRFFSWISVLTIAGVAIGVAAMIVVWSLINGFETELRNRFLAANAHIMAYNFPNGMSNYRKWAEDIKHDFPKEVRGTSPFIHYETMARRESVMHHVLVRGISPKERESVQSLASIVTPASALDILEAEIKAAKGDGSEQDLPKTPAVIVGSGLLSLLEAKVGDIVELVEPSSDDFGEVKGFKIVGVYDSGLKHYDNKLCLISLTTGQAFFKLGKSVHGLEIGLYKPWESVEIASKMTEKYALSIREWQSFNRQLFEAMEMERVVILLITALVAGVAGFNILTTIFVAVSQRQRDISILKSLGATNQQVRILFIKQGVYVGVIGSVIGMVLAYGISHLVERYQFIDLPDLYLLAKLPMSYDWWVYVAVGINSILIAIVAGFIPAWLASRVNPVEGFRGNQGAA